MAQWHYSSQGIQAGPVETAELSRMAQSGTLQPTDLVWKDGMAEWVPASRIKGLFDRATSTQGSMAAAYVPEAAAAGSPVMAQSVLGYQTPGGDSVPVTPRTVEMLRQTKPWVRLFSILLYVAAILIFIVALVATLGLLFAGGGRGGSFMAIFGLFYAAVGALYFFPAMFLGRYANRIGKLMASNRAGDLEDALEAQKSFWKFWGILTAVVLSIYALIFVIALLLGGLGAMRP